MSLTARDLEREPFTALALGPNVLAFDDGTLARLVDGHAKVPPGAEAPAATPTNALGGSKILKSPSDGRCWGSSE